MKFPEGFEPAKVSELLIRLRDANIVPPKELNVPGWERNDEYLAQRRQGQQTLPGEKLFKTPYNHAGWRISHFLATPRTEGFRITDVHVEWRGENCDQPVLTISMKREEGEDVCSSELMSWLAGAVLSKCWKRGMLYANPRVDGSYQLAVDVTDMQPCDQNLPTFRLRDYMYVANQTGATTAA